LIVGLRRSELFALQWKDVDFEAKQIHINRSIVQNVIGVCKTESSQKPAPAHEDLINALREWRRRTPYQSAQNWMFASRVNQGRWPSRSVSYPRKYIPISLGECARAHGY